MWSLFRRFGRGNLGGVEPLILARRGLIVNSHVNSERLGVTGVWAVSGILTDRPESEFFDVCGSTAYPYTFCQCWKSVRHLTRVTIWGPRFISLISPGVCIDISTVSRKWSPLTTKMSQQYRPQVPYPKSIVEDM